MLKMLKQYCLFYVFRTSNYRRMTLSVTVYLLFFTLTTAQSDLFLEEGPRNALKRVGESNMLGCVSINNNCRQIEWHKVEGAKSPTLVYRNSSGMLNGGLFPSERYSVSDAKGCNLTITRLQVNDSGRFICIQSIGDREQAKTAVLIVIDVTDSCLPNVTSSNLVEGDGYSFQCAIVTPAKSVEPSNVALSFQNKAVGEAEAIDSQPQAIRTTLTGTANAADIGPHECRTSFAAVNEPNYDVFSPGLSVCTSQQLNVPYSVRDVTLSPSLSNFPPGTSITCAAKGHPPPTFKWQERDNNCIWKDIHNGGEFNGSVFSSKRYRCVAMNIVRSQSHNATSDEFQVTNTGFNGPSTTTGYSGDRLGIGVGIGFVVAILLATIVIAILVKLKYLEFHPKPAKESLDGRVQSMDHSFPHRSDPSIPKTQEDPLGRPGREQESAYASLEGDRDVNEYASLEH